MAETKTMTKVEIAKSSHERRVKGYRRSATDWHQTVDKHGRTIKYVTSDEAGINAVGVCSIYTPGSNSKSFRRLTGKDEAMTEADEPIPSHGLVVLGRSKFDRPTLEEVAAMADINGADAAEAVRIDLNSV